MSLSRWRRRHRCIIVQMAGTSSISYSLETECRRVACRCRRRFADVDADDGDLATGDGRRTTMWPTEAEWRSNPDRRVPRWSPRTAAGEAANRPGPLAAPWRVRWVSSASCGGSGTRPWPDARSDATCKRSPSASDAWCTSCRRTRSQAPSSGSACTVSASCVAAATLCTAHRSRHQSINQSI